MIGMAYHQNDPWMENRILFPVALFGCSYLLLINLEVNLEHLLNVCVYTMASSLPANMAEVGLNTPPETNWGQWDNRDFSTEVISI